MQNSNSKTENIQLPVEVAAEQSKGCLIKSKENTPCNHQWCLRAEKLPQYHVTRKSLIERNPSLTEFKRFKTNYGTDFYMVASNDLPGRAITELRTFGNWPLAKEFFKNSEIDIQFFEVVEDYPSFDEVTKENVWKQRLNVDEMYVFIGGANNEK